MNNDKPALGVMKIWEYDTAEAYEAKCTCGSYDHTVQFITEIDEYGEVVLTFYSTVSTDYWTDSIKIKTIDIDNPVIYSGLVTLNNIINSIVRKVKLTYNIWVDGHIKYEQSLIMVPKQAGVFANSILDSIERLKK